MYLDANVFLRFLLSESINSHLKKQADIIFLELEQEKYTAHVPTLVLAEVVYVLEKFYKFEKKDIVAGLISLLEYPSIVNSKKDLLKTALFIYKDYNVDFEDAFTVASMRKNGVKEIATFDHKHFNRFSDIKISKKTHL